MSILRKADKASLGFKAFFFKYSKLDVLDLFSYFGEDRAFKLVIIL